MVICRVISTVGVSWNASVPIMRRGTCPVMATIGTESSSASARPVTRFVAPGPDVATHTPTRPVHLAYPSAAKTSPCSWRHSTLRTPVLLFVRLWWISIEAPPGYANTQSTPSRSRASTRMSAPLRGSSSPKRDWKFATGRFDARSCICAAVSSVSVNTEGSTPGCARRTRREEGTRVRRQTSDVRRARRRRGVRSAASRASARRELLASRRASRRACTARGTEAAFFRVWARSLETAEISANAARGAAAAREGTHHAEEGSLSAAVATDLRTGRAACFRGAGVSGVRARAKRAGGRVTSNQRRPGPSAKGSAIARAHALGGRSERREEAVFARVEGYRAIAPVGKRGGAAGGRRGGAPRARRRQTSLAG